MPHFHLRLDTALAGDGQESFYWTLGSDSSFVAGLGPSLGRLGMVPELNIDLVRIAVAVYAADRSTPRKFGGSDWNQRDIELTVPVSDIAAWTAAAGALAGMLDFLSGDTWAFTFVEQPAPHEDIRLPAHPADRVVLLSGGADSAVGALKSRLELPEDGHHVLVSHFSSSHIAPIQERLADQLNALAPNGEQSHEVFHIARKSHRLDGSEFASEPSSRARSFLFLALGLAVAAVHNVDLWIPENGFASINPPLGPGRRGSLSTRTTHPRFIGDFNSLLSRIGISGAIHNPFAALTKGEMFTWAMSELTADLVSMYLSSTNSCSSTGQRSFGVPLRVQCGVCFGCVLRRAAFDAASLTDLSEYADPTDNDKLASWLERTSVVPSVRSFLDRGVRPRDLMALSLPHEYALSDAMDLTNRGAAELKEYVQ